MTLALPAAERDGALPVLPPAAASGEDRRARSARSRVWARDGRLLLADREGREPALPARDGPASSTSAIAGGEPGAHLHLRSFDGIWLVAAGQAHEREELALDVTLGQALLAGDAAAAALLVTFADAP